MGGPGFAAIAAAMLAGQPSADAPACEINHSASPPITEVLRDRGFAFESYDRLCAALRQHGLELTITGTSGIELERAYGWASVTTRRAETGVLSTREHLSTYLDMEATDAVAADVLYEAINTAANLIADEIDQHVQSIEAEEARLREAFANLRR